MEKHPRKGPRKGLIPQQTSAFRAKKRQNDRQFVPVRQGAVWGATPRAKREITLKQRRYCAGRMRGLSRIQAARAAGYGLSAADHPKRIERSPAVAFVLQKWLDRQGISDRALGIEQE